jgi:hypothetical protein
MAQIPIDETTEQPPAEQPQPAAPARAKGGNSQRATRRRNRPQTAAPTAPPAPAATGTSPADVTALTNALQAVLDKADELAEAQIDEGTGVEFVRTGWVRLPGVKPDQVLRLRAPLFGELRDLRTAHEAMYDRDEALRLRVVEAEAEAGGRDAEAKRHLEPERSRMIHESNLTYREVLREVQNAQEVNRAEWWLQVLEVLCVDRVYPVSLDEALPAWLAAPDLPVKVVQHWRSVPLGPGR